MKAVTALSGLSALVGTGSFSPAQIAGLKLWLKADAGAMTDGGAQFVSINNEYLEIADNADLSTGDADFTISCWVMLDTKSAPQHIVAKWQSAVAGNLEYKLEYDDFLDRFRFTVAKPTDSTVGVSADNLGSPAISTWYHITAWHDAAADTINIQVNNGTANSAATGGALQASGTSSFRLGARTHATPRTLNGRMDSTGFWQRTLTSTERATLYNSGNGLIYADLSSGIKSGMTAWWELDELSGTRYDSHGSNHLSDNNTVTEASGIAAGTAADGDPIKTIQDQSGNANHATQTTQAKRPTYKTSILNSLPVMRFDGADDYLDANGAAASISGNDHANTVFAVFKCTNNSGSVIGTEVFDSGTGDHRPFEVAGGNYRALRTDDSGSTVTATGGTTDTTSWHYLSQVFTGTNVSVWIDGSQVINNASLNVGTTTLSKLRIGASWIPSNYWPGDIAELLVYDGALADGDRQSVENYLKTKYGL